VGSIAVNGSGEACISSDPFVKLDTNGSIIYSVTFKISGSTIAGRFAAIDSQGNCYVTGVGIIDPTPGAFQSTPKFASFGQFVMKFDGTGKTVFATYLSGSGTDAPRAITVDTDGNVYVTGRTNSNDYPTLHAFQPALAGADDAFITVLNATGTALIYSTYWGGSSGESGEAIAVDNGKNAYVTGSTSSADFPTVSALQGALAGKDGNAFIAKLDAGGMPNYSTYLGDTGNAGSAGLAIAADSDGNAYVAGSAGTGFPLVTPIQNTIIAQSAFVTKVNATGSALLYSTYLGESATATAIAVDQARNVYVAGDVLVHSVPAGSIPLVSPIQSNFGAGMSDGFVTILSSAGTDLIFSSYLGGDSDGVAGLGIDSATNVYLAGTSTGPFPIVNAPNGVYLPLTFESLSKQFSPAPQAYALKISLLAGTSLSFPTTVDFRPDPLAVGNSAKATVLLANTSTSGNIDITNITITGDYSETNDCPQRLSPAHSCKFQVTFAPITAGDRKGTITVTDTAPGSPHVISLIGTGLVSDVSLSPNSLTFAAQVVSTSSESKVVTLTNIGGATLSIANISTTGDFAESNDCGSHVGANQSCHISVVFSPSATGDRAGALSIIDSASDSPQRVNLSGNGTGPSLGLGVPAGGTSTETVPAGETASYTLSIGGGGIGGTASLSCTGAPKGATCSVPASENVDAVKALTFGVSVTTTSQSGLRAGSSLLGSSWIWALTIIALVLPSAGVSKRCKRCQIAFFSLMLVLLLCSCGDNGSNPSGNPNGTPMGTYNLTINAVSGANTQSTTLTLVVR